MHALTVHATCCRSLAKCVSAARRNTHHSWNYDLSFHLNSRRAAIGFSMTCMNVLPAPSMTHKPLSQGSVTLLMSHLPLHITVVSPRMVMVGDLSRSGRVAGLMRHSTFKPYELSVYTAIHLLFIPVTESILGPHLCLMLTGASSRIKPWCGLRCWTYAAIKVYPHP